ncbi:MAG TPA: carboxypeptidase-like regulatory domain-containing protein [Herpetosiphonaceae bacterium]
MIQHYTRALLLRTGLLLMIGLVLQIAIARPALAQEPPRPTLEPTATPTITPTGTATPTPVPPDDTLPSPTEAPAGRIIGTVIDLTTNAPAPGIRVAVGDITVTTDGNGNYERAGLPAGSYQVALVLTAAQGVAEQGPITVDLAVGATVVQHLAFRSPLAATAVPSTPTPTPTGPATLPDTGDSSGNAALFQGGLLAALIVLLGLSVWGMTERSRRTAIRRR